MPQKILKIHSRRNLLYIVAMIFVMAGCAPAPVSVDPDEPDRDEIVLALGVQMDTAATPAQRQRMERLLKSGQDVPGLADVTVDYPLPETLFPPDLHAPTFLWHDESGEADRWLVEVSFGADSVRLLLLIPGLLPPQGEIDPTAISSTNEIYQLPPYQASAKSWQPSAPVWRVIRDHAVVAPAQVTFFGYREDDPERVLSRGAVSLTISQDPVGAPIFYRDVPLTPIAGNNRIMPLPKNALPLIKWRLRDVSLPASRVIMQDMPTCANCHSFSADGRTLGMDIDGPSGDKGAYAFASIERDMIIESDEIITWNSFADKPEGHKTLGFLSRVSPDGQFALSTVREEIYVANFPDYKFSQVFYPTRGILAYYSRATGDFRSLPGADDLNYVQTDGVWTPDGKTIVFARGDARNPYPANRPIAQYAGDPNETPMQYDLYRVPFAGGKGGVPEPIAGASRNGMSNSFPKVSPDGKWIVFVQCKNGQLMRPDGKLWIVPTAGGEARLMRCNTSVMNSWHSFSPNGRWLVFASKSNTPYTQLFLTHIDEDGNDSPAILLENSTAANRAANIPEFINIDYEELASITVPDVDLYRHMHRANILAEEGRYTEAIAAFEDALEVGSDSRVHSEMAKVYMNLGENEKALLHLELSRELNPKNYEVYNNLGKVLFEKGQYQEAREQLDAAIALFPNQPRAWSNRARVAVALQEEEQAIADFTRALEMAPRFADAYRGRGMVLEARGEYGPALADLNRAVRLDPAAVDAWYFRAVVRAKTGNPGGAVADLDRALKVATDPRQVSEIESLKRRILIARGIPQAP